MIRERVNNGEIVSYGTLVDDGTMEGKKTHFNAVVNRHQSITDLAGRKISITGILVMPAIFENEEGEKNGYKIIMQLLDGSLISGSGNALLQSLDFAIAIFGEPTKENPIEAGVELIASSKNQLYKYVSLQM